MVNLKRESRGQQLNNSVKSVSPSPSKSKASAQRQTRQDSYRAKFNKSHVIIPTEDFIWLKDQSNPVKTLFAECWIADPYGSRWQVLNHSLKSSSFFKAKKILSEQGLFLFKTDRSVLDDREVVCWLVINLHGARRNDYWLKSADSDSTELELNSTELKSNSKKLESNSKKLESISIETQTQQGLQNPSGGISGSSSETPQGVSEELGIESEVGDRHAQPAFDERVGSAPPQEEKKKPANCSLDKKSQTNGSRENPDPIEDDPALTKKSTQELLDKSVPYDWRSDEAIKITHAKNSAIEVEQKTEEYLNASREGLLRIRANLAKQQERTKAEREAQMREDNPMSLTDWQNVEELKREKEAERWQEEALEESPPESLRNDRVINRPAPEDYQDDW